MSRARVASGLSISEIPEDHANWIGSFARRNLTAAAGIGILLLLAMITLALATWHVDDPSLSNATNQPALNLLGYPGAVVADLMMQFFGVAAPLLLLPPGFWAWRMITGSIRRVRATSAAAWIGGGLLGATAIATLSVSGSWPLPTGFGGVVGDLLLRIPEGALGATDGFARILTGMILAVLAAFLSAHAVGTNLFLRLRPGREEARRESQVSTKRSRRAQPVVDELGFDEDVDSDVSRIGFLTVAVGALAHTGYRIRTSIGRLMRRPDEFEQVFGARSTRPTQLDPSLLPDDDELAFEEAEAEDEIEVAQPKPARTRRSRRRPRADGVFKLPPLELLSASRSRRQNSGIADEILEENARLLESVLDDFGIRGEIMNIWPGPVVTIYELEPAPGIKSARVISLADDIARSMSAIACRVAVIPGKNAIGIELPNDIRETVLLRELLSAGEFTDTNARLALCLGKNIGGEPIVADLSRMPHLLVAGTTGSGKSVSINTMILSLLYRMTPESCRLILIDPKMLELSVYDGIPHLLTPVVTDPKKAVVALKWTVREMEDRYRKMSKLGVRNIDGLNARVEQAKERGEVMSRTVHTGFDPETGDPIMEREELNIEPMPNIVVIIDEMADLMMVAGKEIEGAVQRLAQMARAAGIHVVMATQRPSVDVITGTIKANFPTRVSFQVTSKIDSRTILGDQGAEQLLGQGDMLYMVGGGRITRVHGPFVSDEEVEKVVAHLKTQGAPEYLEAITAEEENSDDAYADPNDESNDLYDRAVAVVLRDKKVSTSYIQRRLSIGYNRAASIVERMEQDGVISAANHAGKRQILVDTGDHV